LAAAAQIQTEFEIGYDSRVLVRLEPLNGGERRQVELSNQLNIVGVLGFFESTLDRVFVLEVVHLLPAGQLHESVHHFLLQVSGTEAGQMIEPIQFSLRDNPK